jgi:hypothetical protein
MGLDPVAQQARDLFQASKLEALVMALEGLDSSRSQEYLGDGGIEYQCMGTGSIRRHSCDDAVYHHSPTIRHIDAIQIAMQSTRGYSGTERDS